MMILTRILKWHQAKRLYRCPVKTPLPHPARNLCQCPARRARPPPPCPVGSPQLEKHLCPVWRLLRAPLYLTPLTKPRWKMRPVLKCSLQEERVLLNPLLAESLDHLKDMPLGYLSLIEARINKIRRIKASRMPIASPGVPPRLPPLRPIPAPPEPTATTTEPATTTTLSEAIYSAASNLGTSVPHQTRRMPTRSPDQAETDQAVRVLEGINKAPGTMPDHSEPRTVPWRQRRKIERKLKTKDQSHIQVTTSSAFKSTQVQCQFNIQGGSCLKHLLILVIVVDFYIVLYNWIFHVHLSLPFDFSNSTITVYIWLCILVFYRSVVLF